MQSTSILNVTRVIHTNITSSLAVNPNYDYFACLTREQSLTSSQWIYRLDYYDYHNYNKLETIDVYQTYNTDKHFLTFIPKQGSSSFIAVSTVNNINFYLTSPMRKVGGFLHQQANVYDLEASPDGQLTVLVGQSIVIFKNNGFKQIIFPQNIGNARFCDFSRDGRYMVIASTGALNIYTYQKDNDDYQFQQIPLNSTAPVSYGSITSVQFNPVNSSEIIVGFLDVSPMAYSLVNGIFFRKMNDIQPMSSKNGKVAKYMPDGQRIYSYDYLDGVGLWPGAKSVTNGTVTYRLYYKQNFLLYDAACNSQGTYLIGFVWQSIKIVKIIESTCNQVDGVCSCPNGYSYSYSTFQCQQLSCLQAEYATGVITNNACECITGYVFSATLRKCIIYCGRIDNALLTQPDPYACYCANNWSWNALTRKCVFDCTQISYSTGTQATASSCACISGFIWSSTLNECVCPDYMKPQGGACECISNYYVDPSSNKCVANCTEITGLASVAHDPTQCICDVGYYYAIKNGEAGCQLNCGQISNTISENADFTSCICHEHMDWFNDTCVVNCQAISYSDPSGQLNNTCSCAINYLWIDKIKQCAKNCTGVKYTKNNTDSTLISCPCIDNFAWNQDSNRCEIQCSSIPNSAAYSLIQVDKCDCRPGFDWNPTTYSCQINCGNIWNANNRINDSYCSCNDNQQFNNQTLTCATSSASGIFSSTLAIVGFSVGCVVVLIILAVLVKFCWKFSTEKNEGEKKIKMKDGSKKKDKLIRGKEKVPNVQMEDELKTNERFVSPKKITTNTTL